MASLRTNMIRIPNAQPILRGNWTYGRALDWHHQRYADGSPSGTRSEIGQLLFELKYRAARGHAETLADVAVRFLRNHRIDQRVEAIVPVPPSQLDRLFQPVHELALRIGERLRVAVRSDIITKTRLTAPQKNADQPGQLRVAGQLQGAFAAKDRSLAGKGVLVFDDIYDSGETLREVCAALSIDGGVLQQQLYVLTLTKTAARL